MRTLKNTRLILFALLFPILGYSQVPMGFDCATSLELEDTTWLYQLPWFGNNQILTTAFLGSENTSWKSESTSAICGGITSAQYRVPIKATILHNTDSTGGIAPFWVDSILSGVNALYAQNNTRIQFYLICEPGDLYNTFYNRSISSRDGSLGLFNQVDTDGAIDVFFLDTARVGANGYARFPYSSFPFHSWVLTSRPNVDDISETLAHELAHCLNLLHTAEGIRRDTGDFNSECGPCKQESVSRTRGQGFPCDFVGHRKCEVNGDFLCDTPADPALIDSANLSGCVFTPTAPNAILNEDNWGDTWAPDVSNLMSFAKTCRSTFTPMQTAILIGSVTSYIPNFFPRVENDFDVFEPDNYP
jgi:hypothetical protein